MKNDFILSRRKFLSVLSAGIVVSVFSPSNKLFAFTNGAKGEPYRVKWENTNKMTNDPNLYIQQLKRFTDVFRQYSDVHPAIREAECLRIQYPMVFCDIQDGDLYAGREIKPVIGFHPQSSSFGYYIDEDRLRELIANPATTAKNKENARELIGFWRKNSSLYHTMQAYTPEMMETIGYRDWMSEPVIGAYLYRMSGTQCDFDKLIKLGISGLKKEVAARKKKSLPSGDEYRFCEGMERSLDLFTEIARYYADMANQKARKAPKEYKDEYRRIEKTLRKIAVDKPATLREGIQLMYLYAGLSGTINYGRMDEYLGDLYVKELNNGTLTDEEAIRLLSGVWALWEMKSAIFDSRVIVGGKGRRNEENANRLAYLILETTSRMRTLVPQLTLRFYDGQEEGLYKKALDVIATGNPYPMLYNDDVNIPSVMQAFNVPYDEAAHYLPFGCGEYILNHRSVGTPSGVINLLQALSVVLHNGINPVNNEPVKSVSSPDYPTFDDLWNGYAKTVEMYVEQLAWQEKIEYDIAGQDGSFLYLSMLFDDCIERGKGIFSGGVRYLGGTLESYGNTNTADALTAIKKLVYDDKTMTLEQLVEALDADFEGYEYERKLMLNAPKYGNDNDYADEIKVKVDRHVCETTRDMASKVGLDSYLVVIINNNANTVMGEHTAASADGRKSHTYMANGNSSTGGADKNGLTAYLNSIVKPDTKIHAGAVQNIKFSKEMFVEHRDITEKILQTYWEKGGAQCMINCLNRNDLENAMIHPEQYGNLIVRVGGFSARFVDLSRHVQLEILSRTMY